MKRLWTKNFTIITIGTIISMLGSAVANFAIGLLIFEKTDSTFLYAFFFVVTMLPNVIIPLLAGPYLDKFSRKKVIITLDYLSAIVFALITVLLSLNYFNYSIYLIVGIVVGGIGSVYSVAYESFYPELISEGNFSKAYSISSVIWPICSSIMIPVAAVAQQTFGFVPLFAFNAISYAIAATLEIFIDHKETHIKPVQEKFNFVSEFKEGLSYVRSEKALWQITLFFAVTMFAYAATSTLQLPFFSTRADLGVTKYSLVVSISTLGRVIGGMIHYVYRYPTEKKFNIAIFVYFAIAFIDIFFFRSPYYIMCILMLISGIFSVTSFNIRISATQSYIPSEKRARFTSIFMVITTVGSITGQLVAGVLGEVMPIPTIVTIVMIINMIAIYFFIYRHRESIKVLYNRSV